MPSYNKILAPGSVSMFILFGMMAAKPSLEEKSDYKNLQVLSKKISDKDLDYVSRVIKINPMAACFFMSVQKLEKQIQYSGILLACKIRFVNRARAGLNK
jgi:hypothetical protein